MTSPIRSLPDVVVSVAKEPLASAGDVAKRLADRLESRPVKDLLSGTWLGHPLHPLLTDVPIGAWIASAVLDLLGCERRASASAKLVGIGVLAVLPTAANGLSDSAGTAGDE